MNEMTWNHLEIIKNTYLNTTNKTIIYKSFKDINEKWRLVF